jgi:hypothetical protein
VKEEFFVSKYHEDADINGYIIDTKYFNGYPSDDYVADKFHLSIDEYRKILDCFGAFTFEGEKYFELKENAQKALDYLLMCTNNTHPKEETNINLYDYIYQGNYKICFENPKENEEWISGKIQNFNPNTNVVILDEAKSNLYIIPYSKIRWMLPNKQNSSNL